jgi:hypothetical protein
VALALFFVRLLNKPHYLDLGQKIPVGAPEGLETNGQPPPNSTIPTDADETVGTSDSPPGPPAGSSNFNASRKSDGEKTPSKGSAPLKEDLSRGSSSLTTQPLPADQFLHLDQQGWSADYSLPIGNSGAGDEEVTR